jgi:RNA polymerase primary sigma factor
VVAGLAAPNPYLGEDLEEQVGELLKALTIEEASIVRCRFGIGMTERHTLSQVAALLGWAPPRVKRLSAQAMTKLRNAESVTRSSTTLTTI